MIFLGIDPGLSGAICVIRGDNSLEFFDTPVLQMKVNKSVKNQMDAHACSLLLSSLTSSDRDDCLVSVEKVQPMPSFNSDPNSNEPRRSMGATSAFNFGVGFGMWQGICAALILPYQLVHPATWKRMLMRDMEKGKDAGRVKAMQLYPHSAKDLTRKKDHGRADALLLAHYGKITYSPHKIAAEVQDDLELF